MFFDFLHFRAAIPRHEVGEVGAPISQGLVVVLDTLNHTIERTLDLREEALVGLALPCATRHLAFRSAVVHPNSWMGNTSNVHHTRG